MNYFHSIVYSQSSEKEIERHNMLRYKLEEELKRIYLDKINNAEMGIRLNEFAHDKMRTNFDIY